MFTNPLHRNEQSSGEACSVTWFLSVLQNVHHSVVPAHTYGPGKNFGVMVGVITCSCLIHSL